ncbi:tRNA (N6-threonylcarbamoyladenosine(37)-N6)-methyltransferase TrmO [Anaerolineales bacterium HSG24]|nr:tRNA (N6-threonylcarbamoyladenosine(37)-N6)-methyltransferase TrmO [Anaerolineales bacterium HSG24]
MDKITFSPIGYVKSQFTDHAPSEDIRAHSAQLVINPELFDGLMGLQVGADILVLCHFNKVTQGDVALQLHPRDNPDNPLRGVFATRSQYRPNPIAATVARIEGIEENIISVTALDALNETPILDIKPYVPHFDAESKHPASDIRAVSSLDEARHLIDLIDTEVIRLFGKRAKYVHQVVQFKNNPTEIRAQKRYDEVMRRRREMASAAGLNPDVIEQMYKLLVENFIKEEMEILRQRQGNEA